MWLLWPSSHLDALVIDKTVRDESRQEHQAFNWILNNEKKHNSNEEAYDLKKDYLGYFPEKDSANQFDDLRNYSENSIDSLAETLDMLYYTDAEGPENPHLPNKELQSLTDTNSSVGVSSEECLLMESMDARSKLVLAEYNTLAYPTNPEIRVRLEQLFDVKFSGWIGRHFRALDKSSGVVPKWIIEGYETYTGEDYNFSNKDGIVLVHETGKVLVLEMDEHLSASFPMINTNLGNMEKWELPNFISYPFWFDITLAENPDHVISGYKIHTTREGDSVLSANGLTNKFPAVIGSEKGNRFYFCGDFADNPILQNLSYFKGINLLSYLLTSVSKEPERKRFFWNYYRPLILNILNSYESGEQLASIEENDFEIDTNTSKSQHENYAPEEINNDITSPADQNLILENLARFTVGGRISQNMGLKEFEDKEADQGSGPSFTQTPINPAYTSANNENKKWRIVIASLQSKEGTSRYLKKLNNPEISAVWVDYLQTNRISFGPFENLGLAQQKYSQVLQNFPDAWMIKF